MYQAAHFQIKAQGDNHSGLKLAFLHLISKTKKKIHTEFEGDNLRIKLHLHILEHWKLLWICFLFLRSLQI